MDELKSNYKNEIFNNIITIVKDNDGYGFKTYIKTFVIISNYAKKIDIGFREFPYLQNSHKIIIPNNVQYMTSNAFWHKNTRKLDFVITNNLKIIYEHTNANDSSVVYYINHKTLFKKHYYYLITNNIFQHSLMFGKDIKQFKNIFLIENMIGLKEYDGSDFFVTPHKKYTIVLKNIRNVSLMPYEFKYSIKLRNIYQLYVYNFFDDDNNGLNMLCNVFKLCFTNVLPLQLQHTNKIIKNNTLLFNFSQIWENDNHKTLLVEKMIFMYVVILNFKNTDLSTVESICKTKLLCNLCAIILHKDK